VGGNWLFFVFPNAAQWAMKASVMQMANAKKRFQLMG